MTLRWAGRRAGQAADVAAQLGDGEALLILDDYHVITTEAVHSSLRFLPGQRPPGLRFTRRHQETSNSFPEPDKMPAWRAGPS
jgi:hypothetical protein